jgi:GntR family transcriptional regulator/MocR family aminotransferase
VPIPVDEGGLRVDELARHPGLRAVLVTPAHQFPTGTVLAPERRAALLRWAHDVDGVILEDDYDAEFRYDRRPVGTLQGLDPARVVLFGSLSKMMSPALGIGWAVAPPRWGQRLREIGPPSGPPPTLDQLAFAELLTSGGYERHLRSCRQRYRHRRDALVAALSRELPAATLSGIAAGLHVVLQLPGGPDAAAVVAAASARSVAVAALAGYYAVGDLAAPGTALVLGYGNLADTGVDDAVGQLAAAIRDAG